MTEEIILSPELEGVVRQFGGYFEVVFGRLGEVERRLGQIERLLSIRLNTKLGAVPGGDASDAAELLRGIREGVEVETVLLDIGTRLHDLEYHCFAPNEGGGDEAPGTGEPEGGLRLVHSGESESPGEDPGGDADETGPEAAPEQ